MQLNMLSDQLLMKLFFVPYFRCLKEIATIAVIRSVSSPNSFLWKTQSQLPAYAIPFNTPVSCTAMLIALDKDKKWDGCIIDLIGLTAALQGLHFAVFAFSDLRKQIVALSLPVSGSMIMLLFFLPIADWLISLFITTRVFVPKMHLDVHLNDMSVSAWQQIRQKYESILEKKLNWSRWSHIMLVVSFGAVLLMLVILALFPAPPASGPTPIIIVTPTPVSSPAPTP